MKKNLVVKDNALINSSYFLDLTEQRLILLAIVEARESGKGINANDPLEVHAESYMKHFSVAKQTAYEALKTACANLFERQFSYQAINKRGNVENYKSRWVSEICYVNDEATVKMVFAPAVVPLITRLEERFTQYDIQQVSGLTSIYAIRLYEILSQWKSLGKTKVIELSELKEMFGIGSDEYTRMDNFKTIVLDAAVKQINKKTDIRVKYTQHKSGRVITGFSFNFEMATSQKEIKLSNAQILKYSMKLARRQENEKYAHGNESYEALAAKIADMLRKDPSPFIGQLKDEGFTSVN